MKRLALLGVSQRRHGSSRLADWHERHQNLDLADAYGLTHHVTLATCNRWEVVTALPAELDVRTLRDALKASDDKPPYAYVGEAAVERLMRIAAGLDSLNPGEDQIMQQVRHAYLAARDAGRINHELSFAFERSMQAAKRIRRTVALAPVNTSLFSLARPRLEALHAKGATTALVIGAGEMGQLAARSLASIGFQVELTNRSETRGQEAAAALNARFLPLGDVLENPGAYDVIVTATPAKDLLPRSTIANTGAITIVDLGMPRNVNPDAAADAELIDAEQLEKMGRTRRASIETELGRAERLLLAELDEAMNEWNERQLGPSIVKMKERMRSTLEERLGQEDADRLVGRLVHDPIKGLRAIAREHGVDVARTYLQETGIQE